MAIFDNPRLLVKVCRLFYEDNLSQKEISSILNISRPQISRMLNYAKENNIVQITIQNPYTHEIAIEQRLMEKFHLKGAFVTDIIYKDSDEMRMKLGEQCAEQLDTYLTDYSSVGVMSGKTIAAVANATHRLNRTGLEFIPLVGCMGPQGQSWQANLIAQTLAQKTGGSYCTLDAPVLMQSEAARQYMLHEPAIAKVLEKGTRCNVLLVGIGQISTTSTAYEGGAFVREDITDLISKGAVASVCTSYLSSDGKIIDTSLNSRSIGLPLQKNDKTTVIAIVAGPNKIEPTKAALASGFIDVLMTTLDFAEQLLD